MRLLVPVVIVLLASAAQAVTPLWRTDLPATCRFDNITTNVYRPTAPVFKPGSDLVYVATSCGPLHTGPTSVVGLKASTGETVVSTTLPGLSNPTALATFSNSGSYLLPVLNASHNPTIAQVDGTSATWTAPTEVTSGYIYDLQVVGDTVVYQLEDYALFFTKLSSPAPTATVYLRALSYSATDGTHFITAVGFPENYTGGVFVYDVNGSVISSLQLPVGAGVPCSRPVFKDASHSVFVVATSGQYTVLHVVSLTPSGTLTLLTSFPLVDQPVYPLYYLNSPWVQLAMSADSSLLYLMGAISISAYDVATQKNVFYTRSPSVIDPTISLGVSSSGVLVVRAFVGYTSTTVAAVNGTDGSVISLVSAGVPWAASALTPYVVSGNTLVVCSDYMTPQQDPSIQAYCAGFAL